MKRLFFDAFYQEQDYNLYLPKATERLENVQCTFLVNGRASAEGNF